MKIWRVTLEVWPYSTGKGCEIDQKNAGDRVQKYEVRAETIGDALEKAKCIVTGLEASPHVWQAPIFAIERISP